MRNKLAYIIILVSCLILKTNAQFLDKHYYLVDSITGNEISKEDKNFLGEQINGPDAKKVKIKLFKEWLSAIATFDTAKQKLDLEKKLSDWKNNIEQTDDILVIGIKA